MTRILMPVWPAMDQTSDSGKYARCAASSEVQQCRALVDVVAAETPEAKRARVEKLEKERLSAAQQVVKNTATNLATVMADMCILKTGA